MFSPDPELEATIRDVAGLYLDPAEKAVVVCIDEKTKSRRSTAPPRSCRSDLGAREAGSRRNQGAGT